MITYDRADSPTDKKCRWTQIISVPVGKIRKPTTLNKRSGIYRVGDWMVVVWPKAENLTGSEADEVTLYEASKGNLPSTIQELGETRIRAIWREEWATLIEVCLGIEVLQEFVSKPRKQRYSGAVVEDDRALQIWTQIP